MLASMLDWSSSYWKWIVFDTWFFCITILTKIFTKFLFLKRSSHSKSVNTIYFTDGIFPIRSEYCYNTVEWKRGLRRLYQIISSHLDGMADKFRIWNNGLTEAPKLSREFIILAARLCCKVSIFSLLFMFYHIFYNEILI